MPQSIRCSKLFIFVFLVILLPLTLNAYPMFMHAIQSKTNASPKHHHRREWHKYDHQQNLQKNGEMSIIEAILGAGENANENGIGIGKDELERTTTTFDNNEAHESSELGQRMRINTGQWAWSEAHSIREEVYLFAFTYFGMVTILMICLIILVSCCYMYDCMGCYKPFWKQSKGRESNTNTIVPFDEGNGQMLVIGGGEKATNGWNNWKKKTQERRWSLV